MSYENSFGERGGGKFIEIQNLELFLVFACRFCTSAADLKIRLFTSDLQEKNEYKVCWQV